MFSSLQQLRESAWRDKWATFDDVTEWCALLPDQQDGPPCSTCDTGEPYVELIHGIRCRNEPFDVELATSDCCNGFLSILKDYLTQREGAIYWRIKPEIEYRDDGPDVDDLTDRRCVMDRRFAIVKIYSRLIRTNAPKVHDHRGAINRECGVAPTPISNNALLKAVGY